MLKVFINSIPVMLIEKLVRVFSQLIFTIALARYLGSETFGLYSYLFSVIYLFNAFANLGFDSIFVKFIGERKTSVLGTGAILRLLALIAGAPVACLLIFGLELGEYFNLAVVLYLGLVPLALNVLVYHFQYNGRAQVASWVSIGVISIFLLMKIYFIIGGLGLYGICWLLALENLAVVSVLFLFYFAHLGGCPSPKFDAGEARTIIKAVTPLVMSSMLVSLYMRMDQIMIGSMLGEYYVGLYAAGSRIAEGLYFIPIVLVTAIFPYLVINKRDNIQIERIFQNLYSSVFLISVVSAGVFFLYGSLLIEILFGVEFSESYYVLAILSVNMIFVSMGAVSTRYLALYELQNKLLYRSVFAIIVNAALNYCLIPSYGINGAALATLSSQFFSNYLYDYFDSDLRRVVYLKNKSLFFYFYLSRK